jgi:hypothetical protein
MRLTTRRGKTGANADVIYYAASYRARQFYRALQREYLAVQIKISNK